MVQLFINNDFESVKKWSYQYPEKALDCNLFAVSNITVSYKEQIGYCSFPNRASLKFKWPFFPHFLVCLQRILLTLDSEMLNPKKGNYVYQKS